MQVVEALILGIPQESDPLLASRSSDATEDKIFQTSEAFNTTCSE